MKRPEPRQTWRPVVGHESRYEVSSEGHVRSLDCTLERRDGRQQRRRGTQLRPGTDTSGHQHVTLYPDKVGRSIHQLVMEAFVGPRPAGMETRHLNGDPTDNRLSNLQYGTQSQNQRDRLSHGTHNAANRTHCPRRHQLVAPNLVPSKLPKRQCLACHSARSAKTRLQETHDWFLADADRRYASLMEGAET